MKPSKSKPGEPPADTNAATKIQSRYRGRKARKAVHEKKAQRGKRRESLVERIEHTLVKDMKSVEKGLEQGLGEVKHLYDARIRESTLGQD